MDTNVRADGANVDMGGVRRGLCLRALLPMYVEPIWSLLQLAKLLHYAGHERAAKVTFGVFAAVFFLTRLMIFPVK